MGEILEIGIRNLHDVLLPVLVAIWIILEWLEPILSFKLLCKCYFDKSTHISAKLTVTIAHTKKMDLRQLLYIWLQNIRILIDLVRIVRVVANARGEGKLPNTVLSLFLRLLF